MLMYRSLPALLVPLLIALSVASSERALAWGERGHDLVARVAARLIIESAPKGDDFAAVLQTKEHMLGHLANVPDIVWRNLGPEIEAKNGPTHYVDLEYLDPTPAFATLPRTVAEEEAKMTALCAQPPKNYVCPGTPPKAAMAGVAPFRIQQLFDKMVEALTRAHAAGTAPAGSENKKALVAAVDEALIYGGTLAHFVGDLGNPWHGTRDYNGWDTAQGGVHKFFEEDVVNALPLSLDEDVIAEALRSKPRERVLKQVPEKSRAAAAKDPLSLAWALTLDSATRLADVRALDKKVAVVKPSSQDKGLKVPAERKEPREVRGEFRAVITERLATSADVLAMIWSAAYEAAGKPSLAGYQSWYYPLKPDFIDTGFAR